MCILLASLYLGCEHLTFHPAICASNPHLLKDLLVSDSTLYHITDTTITIHTRDNDFQTIMAEPLSEENEDLTFSKTTPAYSVLDCPRFNKQCSVKEVQTFYHSCPACVHACEEIGTGSPRRHLTRNSMRIAKTQMNATLSFYQENLPSNPKDGRSCFGHLLDLGGMRR
jgi:hypothetical protein